MRYRVFKVPAGGCEQAEGELNRFLAGVRPLKVERQFVQDGAVSFWSLCVEYLDSPKVRAQQGARERTDYKEILSDEDFAVFARLRDLRKAVSAEDAVPPYAVFTNEQLAAMAQGRPATLAALQKIDGIGVAKTTKYGERFLAAIGPSARSPAHAAGEQPLPQDR